MTNQQIINKLKQGKKFRIGFNYPMSIFSEISGIDCSVYYFYKYEYNHIFFTFGKKYLIMKVIVNGNSFISKISYNLIKFLK